MISVKESVGLIVVVGIIVWALAILNGFVGGGNMFSYIGTGVAWGFFIIVIGLMAWIGTASMSNN